MKTRQAQGTRHHSGIRMLLIRIAWLGYLITIYYQMSSMRLRAQNKFHNQPIVIRRVKCRIVFARFVGNYLA
jgi:hypothetical protein